MDNQKKIENLKWFNDNLKKFIYTIDSEGIERTNDIKNRIFEKLDISNKNYIASRENIKKHLNNIDRGGNFIEELDKKIIRAIEIYVGDAYKDINSYLRENKGLVRGENKKISYTTDWINFEEVSQEAVIDALDNLINRTELTKEIILYRAGGISKFKELNITSPEELIFSIGKKITEYGYSSTSVEFEGFWCENCPIVMINKVLPGTHICGIGFSKVGLNTGEILIERNVEYKIVDVEIIDNKVFVYTEVNKIELKKEIKRVEDIDLEVNKISKQSDISFDDYFFDDTYGFDYLDSNEESLDDSAFKKNSSKR